MASAPPPKRRPDRVAELKIVLVGEIGVGKTSTVARFTRNQFDTNVESTIGASYMAKEVQLENMRLKYSIWDTAGQEQYHSLVPMYFRQAVAVVLVYDITKRASFEAAQKWIDEVHKHAPEGVIIAVAGNKSDLPDRQVDVEEAERWAKEVGGTHHSTSAKTSEGITEMFENIGRVFMERKPEAPAVAPAAGGSSSGSGKTNLNSNNKPKEKKGCPCS